MVTLFIGVYCHWQPIFSYIVTTRTKARTYLMNWPERPSAFGRCPETLTTQIDNRSRIKKICVSLKVSLILYGAEDHEPISHKQNHLPSLQNKYFRFRRYASTTNYPINKRVHSVIHERSPPNKVFIKH